MANKKNALNNRQVMSTTTKSQNENRDYNSFKTVLKYCLFIILFPVFTFFSSKIVFDGYLNLNTIQSNIWSAVLAVIALHIALGLYIYRAYFEVEVRDMPGAKKLE